MKISELIEKLQHQKNLWGDLPVIHNLGVYYEPTYDEVDDVQPIDIGGFPFEHETIGKPPTSIELL
jgi:hypothetical protein